MSQREYTKPPLSINEQIEHIKKKNILFKDEEKAKSILKFNNYYRLSGYWKYFEGMNNIYFEDIYSLYSSDKRLRILLLEMIEKYEISVKTLIAYELSNYFNSCSQNGGHKYLDLRIYDNKKYYFDNLKNISREIRQRMEISFIKHYFEMYGDKNYFDKITGIFNNSKHFSYDGCKLIINKDTISFCDLTTCFPQIWIMIEIMSLGNISRMYKNLNNATKKEIKIYEKLKFNIHVFETFFEHIVDLRNICAHHSRIWNVSLPSPLRFQHTSNFKEHIDLKQFCNTEENEKKKIYNTLVYMIHVYEQLDAKECSEWKLRLISLVTNSKLYFDGLGFTSSWEELEIWKKNITAS